MSDNITITYLKKFNERFVEMCVYFRQLAPHMKELILVEDGIDFCIQRGNPEIPVSLFYNNIMKFKANIMGEDDMLFEENIIMGELQKALINNKNMINDDNYSKYKDVLSNNEERIRDKIQTAKNIWIGLSSDQRKKIWRMLQICVKLSEKYAERRGELSLM